MEIKTYVKIRNGFYQGHFGALASLSNCDLRLILLDRVTYKNLLQFSFSNAADKIL